MRICIVSFVNSKHFKSPVCLVTVLTAIFVSAIPMTALGAPPDSTSSSPENLLVTNPRDTVKAYCRFDFEGARLGGDVCCKGMERLYTWEAEPGWDTASFVSSYYVDLPQIDGDKAKVVVRYQTECIGAGDDFAWKGSTEFERLQRAGGEDRIEFNLTKTAEGWKIAKPIIWPRVGLKAATKHLRSLLKDEQKDKNEKRIAVLKDGIHQLESLAEKKSPKTSHY